ncbi:MAG: aminotransferase class I/II-fold pyridoxal phosphate-dependent enzyme [Acidobacteriota bacterium]|nr:aminotransferase class I/II-fold pyridoxal phosphate-dependent enzyme [Acidobacteriota bacterium]
MPENAIHRFRNNVTAIPHGNKGWNEAWENRLLGIRVKFAGDDRFEDKDGDRFVNLCSCSYLGLNQHPALREGAIEALSRERLITMPISRVRLQLTILDELETGLESLFRARAVTTISCSAASAGVLPLIASGHLTDDGEPRVMVFDKFCHFSMNLIKPICADETTVLTAPHNDLNYVEDVCKKHRRVAYVADGVYSMGGATKVSELLALQDRYGLFLYLDDSHSLSVLGEHGEGYVRSQLPDELPPLTIVVASLAKAFGASGGVIMLGPRKHEPVLSRFGGPMAWSQGPNIAAMGASMASIKIHRSPELGWLQRCLQDNVAIFDSRIDTEQSGNGLPIRLIPIGEEARTTEYSRRILEAGFYTSAVFFPIVEKGKAGLRIMIRADSHPDDIRRFCDVVQEVVKSEGPGLASA